MRQHDHHDAEQDKDVFEDSEDAGGEHLVQRVHVRSETGDQTADGVAIKEGDVHALQVAEDLRTHVVHDLLAGPLHEVGLGKLQHVREAERADVDESDLGDAGGGRIAEMASEPGGLAGAVVRHVAVDGDFGQVGAEDVRESLEDDGNQRNAGLPLVGAQVFEQTAHQPAVIRLADDIFFVRRRLVVRLLVRSGLLRTAGPGLGMGFGHAFLHAYFRALSQ